MGLNIGQIIWPAQRTIELVGEGIQRTGQLAREGIKRVIAADRATNDFENQRTVIRVLTAAIAILGGARYIATEDPKALNAGIGNALLYVTVTYPCQTACTAVYAGLMWCLCSTDT